MTHERTGSELSARRTFLRQVAGGAGALIAAGGLAPAMAEEPSAKPSTPAAPAAPSAAQSAGAATPAPLPTIRLGKFAVTRLIVGGNPIGGYAHSTPAMQATMLEYFTHERTVEFLLRCEGAGINTWQFDHFDYVVKALRIARERGSKLQFVCLHHDKRPGDLKTVIANLDPIGIVHHGQVTDRSFREGKPEVARDFVKRVKDLGVLAGVSTHSPENLKRIEDEGWENDFYMTSFYHVSRSREEQVRRFGTAAVHDPFFETDPAEMTSVIRQVKKPCLAFKVLAAGRKCFAPEEVGECFRYAFSSIKATDAVIVGMFPKYRDEIAEDVALARKHGAV